MEEEPDRVSAIRVGNLFKPDGPPATYCQRISICVDTLNRLAANSCVILSDIITSAERSLGILFSGRCLFPRVIKHLLEVECPANWILLRTKSPTAFPATVQSSPNRWRGNFRKSIYLRICRCNGREAVEELFFESCACKRIRTLVYHFYECQMSFNSDWF